MVSPKLHRWLDLIVFLAPHRCAVPIEAIMEGVPGYATKWRSGDDTSRGSAKRIFHRDRKQLRPLGIRIESESLPGQFPDEPPEGYRLDRKKLYLPYIRLLQRGTAARGPTEAGVRRSSGLPLPVFEIDEEELTAALEGLLCVAALPDFPFSAEAHSAWRKLTFDLDRARLPDCPHILFPSPGATDVRPAVALLTEARRRRKRVTFRYHGIRRGVPTDRDIAPYGLFFQWGAWYAVGHDKLRNALRTFRISRMDELEMNSASPEEADYEIPSEFDLTTQAGLRPWEFNPGGRAAHTARVLFRYPTSLWAARNDHGSLVREHADRSAVRLFTIRDEDAFLRWILGQKGDAVILEPSELRAVVGRTAKDLARRHRSSPPAGPVADVEGNASDRHSGRWSQRPRAPERRDDALRRRSAVARRGPSVPPLHAVPPAADATTRLARLLAILPAAVRRGESSLSELADELDLDERTVAEDLRQIAERDDEEPAGAEAALQILLEGDRVYVFTTADFSRPVRLTPAESLALVLGLRLIALSPSVGDRPSRENLRVRLEVALAGASREDLARAFEAPDLGEDRKGIREVIQRGAQERRHCLIRYLKADADEPRERSVEPWCVVHAEGHDYVLALEERGDAVRYFRLDRILEARLEEACFQVREGVDPSVHLRDGRALAAVGGVEAVVRYAPPVARWVAENTPGVRRTDGSLVVRHRVLDRDWLIRHVLRHAGDAELLEPAALREAVAAAAERIERAYPPDAGRLNRRTRSRRPKSPSLE